MSNLYTVTLLRDHIHSGKQYEAGDSIKVAQHDKAFMAALGIIAPEKSSLEAGTTNKSKGDK